MRLWIMSRMQSLATIGLWNEKALADRKSDNNTNKKNKNNVQRWRPLEIRSRVQKLLLELGQGLSAEPCGDTCFMSA